MSFVHPHTATLGKPDTRAGRRVETPSTTVPSSAYKPYATVSDDYCRGVELGTQPAATSQAMPLAGGTGASSPYIADGDDPMLHGGEFNDIPDDALENPNLFFSNNFETFQSIQPSSKNTSSRQLMTPTASAKIEPADFPSSPSGSFREDSSDSASSSKKESPGPRLHLDQAMGDANDAAMDWAGHDGFHGEAGLFSFGNEDAHSGGDTFFNWAGTPGESATDDANQMSRPNYMDETSPSLTVATSTSEGKMAALGTHAEQHGRKNSVSFILTSRCPYLNCKVNR